MLSRGKPYSPNMLILKSFGFITCMHFVGVLTFVVTLDFRLLVGEGAVLVQG